MNFRIALSSRRKTTAQCDLIAELFMSHVSAVDLIETSDEHHVSNIERAFNRY